LNATGAPSDGRIALYFQDEHSIRDSMKYAEHAERRGFETIWQAENRLWRDPTIVMAAMASVTKRIKVASGILNLWSRNPGALASIFSTLDAVAPGRVVLGIGSGWDPMAARMGIVRRKNVQAMREVVTVVRDLLRMERVTFHGEFVDFTALELDIVYHDADDPGPANPRGHLPKDIPIYIGATGLKMMELAGEIADGALLNYVVPPEYNRDAVRSLAAGAARAGRSLDEIDRPQLIVCSLDDDRAAAIDRAREMVTQYLAQQKHTMKASGVDQALLDEIRAALVSEVDGPLVWPAPRGAVRKAMRVVPDKLVQSLAAAGTADEVRAKIRAYVDEGCTCPVLHVLGDVDRVIEEFAGGAY